MRHAILPHVSFSFPNELFPSLDYGPPETQIGDPRSATESSHVLSRVEVRVRVLVTASVFVPYHDDPVVGSCGTVRSSNGTRNGGRS